MTESGDYRYLEGREMPDGTGFFLSCFDGMHAFLFQLTDARAHLIRIALIAFSRDGRLRLCTLRTRQKVLGLEHYLNARDEFIELVITKLRVCGAKIRPRVNVVGHQLDGVAVNVVVEPGSNGMDAVVAHLTGI